MPVYEKGPVRIHYEEAGAGFPLLIIPGGGLNSTIAGLANDQGIGWADNEGPFSLDGSSPQGDAEGCGTPCPRAMNARNDNEPYAFHPAGGNSLFADGHVACIS